MSLFVICLVVILATMLPIRKPESDAYWLIYASDRIYQVTIDGEYRQALTPPEQFRFSNPIVAPDGDSLAYIGHNSASRSLYCQPSVFYHQWGFDNREILKQDDFCPTDTAFSEINFLSWSPDGQWLVFDYHPSYLTFTTNVVVPPRQVYRIRLDGTGHQALTNESGDQIQPRGHRMANGLLMYRVLEWDREIGI